MEIRSVIVTIVAVTLGVMMCGSLLIPIASDVMADLTRTDGNGDLIIADGDTWAAMVGVVVLVSLISLIVVALYSYTEKR